MEVLKPTLRVLLHADVKGCEMGSAAGLVLYAPYALYKNETVSIAGAACMAAVGSGVGASAMILHSAYKMARMSNMDDIKTASSELQVTKVDKACAASAMVGMALGVNRLAWMAKNDNITLPTAIASKRGVWVIAAYTMLGVGVCYASYIAFKTGETATAKIKAKMQSKSIDAENAEPAELDEETSLVDAANGAVDAASAAVTDSVDAATAE